MPRLFFAIFPDELVRRQIINISSQLPDVGRKVRQENLHATLLFLGDVPEEEMENVKLIANEITNPSFDLQLDAREWWRNSEVTCLSASSIPDPLEQLINSLNTSFQAFGNSINKHPFKLHVTLMRGVTKPSNHLTFKPIPWLVKGFSLVESKTVSGYSEYGVIQSWDFVG